ncbi:MAG: hypothetical protein KJN96_06970 [Eudoraea sp.]|nr:hypothetical protein [Eudoraea sp.]
MKRHKFFALLMILASGFLFVQCTSDYPEAIQGPPGQDGTNGVDGQDGVSGTASCVSCHNNTLRSEIEASFAVSLHRIGETWEERGFYFGGTSCSKCHSGPGYAEFIETGGITPSPDLAAPMSCNTCHSNHDTFDFENDGPDYALRNTDPSNLDLAPNISIDFGDASNTCITCHQPRDSYEIPALNADGTYVINSSRFGPHHSPQATMLEGVLGAEIPGAEAYPARASATHRTASSCVSCHMGESNVASVGGHSWVPTDESCLECHTNGVPDELSGYTTDMATLLSLLQTVEGVAFEVDAEGDPVFDANGNFIPTDSVVVGIIQAGSEDRTNSGIFSDEAAMAAWNYKTLLEDQSRGIHNPGYSRALLKNSLEALQN